MTEDRDGRRGKDDDNGHQHLTAASSCSRGGNKQRSRGEGAMTEEEGSDDDKNNGMGQDDTNTDNEGADNDDGDQEMKTNEEVDGAVEGPANQVNGNRTTSTTQHPPPSLRAIARRVEGMDGDNNETTTKTRPHQARPQDNQGTRNGNNGRRRGGGERDGDDHGSHHSTPSRFREQLRAGWKQGQV